jgi:hypothetical protein
MAKTESKTYCGLYTFIKDHNKELYDIVDDLCAHGLFSSKNDITFLNPNKKLTKKLVDMCEEGKSEKASNLIKAFFFHGKNDKLTEDLVNYNLKKCTKDTIGKTSKSKVFKQWDKYNNASVFDYEDDSFPVEGDESARPPKQKRNGAKKGGSENNQKSNFTEELMNKKDPKLVAYTLNSLINYCKSKDSDNDTKYYDKLIHRLDPNVILSWYIIVQPNKTEPCYITHTIFNEWKSSSIQESTDILCDIFKNTSVSKDNLNKARKERENAKSVYEEYNELLDRIKKSYEGHEIYMLEDELRFRFTNDSYNELFENIGTLNGLDWNTPNDNLVLLCKSENLMQSATHECLKKFIDTNAFHYTLLNDEMCVKIEDNLKKIQGGGNGRKKIIKILGNDNRSNFNKITSKSDKELMQSFIMNLNKTQKKMLKDML